MTRPILMLALLLGLVLGSVVGAGAQAAEPVTAERIVAVVNSEIILLSELKERAVLVGQAVDENAPPAERRKQEKGLRALLDKMIDEVLVTQQATELKLTVEAADVDHAIDEVRKQNNLTEEQFVQALQGQGYTLAGYRKELRKQILRYKVINTAVRSRIQVTDDEVRAYYHSNARKLGGGGTHQVHLRHVLIAVEEGADAKVVEAARAKARQVVEAAHAGQDMATLAGKYSDDEATKDKGGDLGYVDESILADEMASAIAGARDGEVRGPVRTGRGFEVLQVVETRVSDGDVRPFDEVKEQLRQQLYAQQLEKNTASWLAEIRKKAHIDVRL